MSVQLLALLTNIVLALGKFVIGTLAGSRALVADAFNSTGDVLATFIAWLAFRYGERPPDENHHYGHGNAEVLAGLLTGAMICMTGAFIAIDGVLAVSSDAIDTVPGVIAAWAALATAVVKEALYRISMRKAAVTRSPTLLASARDHRADVFASLVAFAGILLARSGMPAWDAVAAIGIGIYIFVLGIDPVRSNAAVLMHEAPPELQARAARLAAEVEGVRHVRELRVQPIGGHYRIDVVLTVDGALTVSAGHDICDAVEDHVGGGIDEVTEVHVHVEPDDAPGDGVTAPGS